MFKVSSVYNAVFDTYEFAINRLVGWLFCFNAYQPFQVKTVLLKTIQFNISSYFKCQKQFCFKQFSLV